MKILVVDDEKLLVKGMKFNLENEGSPPAARTATSSWALPAAPTTM